MITIERLREQLSYDPEAGLFRWLVSRKRGNVVAGKIAGCFNSKGAIRIGIDGKSYLAHRLAWFYMTRVWPSDQIDHRNLKPADNRWSNLRQATPSQNQANTRRHRPGLKGATLHKRTGKYQAQIKRDGFHVYLGLFDTELAAHQAYARAAETTFGEFARIA